MLLIWYLREKQLKKYDEIIKKGLITKLEHAAYLGAELEKAEIAMITRKDYIQDFDLF